MKRANGAAVLGGVLIIGATLWAWSTTAAAIFVAILIVLEIFAYATVTYLRTGFQWLITKRDRYPEFDTDALKKFIDTGHDQELGWIRKPNTSKAEVGKHGKTHYHIDEKGRRCNPGHENLPQLISCYGDSFTFARQVNDDETFEWHLSNITDTNVLNFGVGNFGLDQTLLRLKREFPSNRTPIVIIGVVPSTIVRILCVWKHYNEFGNTFAFKPRFKLVDGELVLIRNIVDTEDKILRYREFLHEINHHDHFYDTKFREDMIHFPYLVSILSNPRRNLPLLALVAYDRWFSKNKNEQPYAAPVQIIMDVNLRLRRDLFQKNAGAVALLDRLVDELVNLGAELGFSPVFMWMPQKDDMLYLRDHPNFYQGFINGIEKRIQTLDLTPHLLARNDIDDLYSDDSHYGGHFSPMGNKLVASLLHEKLQVAGLVESLVAKGKTESV